MKKIYVSPLTKVVKIKPVQMICQSQNVNLFTGVEINGTEEGFEMADKDFDEEDVFYDLW